MSSRVGRLNPRWNDSNPDYTVNNILFLFIDPLLISQKTGFNKAVQITGEEFTSICDGFVHVIFFFSFFSSETECVTELATSSYHNWRCYQGKIFGRCIWKDPCIPTILPLVWPFIHSRKRAEHFRRGYLCCLQCWRRWLVCIYPLPSILLLFIFPWCRRVQAVPITPGSFVNRKPLPEPWRGKRDQELSQLSGIENCIFIR